MIECRQSPVFAFLRDFRPPLGERPTPTPLTRSGISSAIGAFQMQLVCLIRCKRSSSAALSLGFLPLIMSLPRNQSAEFAAACPASVGALRSIEANALVCEAARCVIARICPCTSAIRAKETGASRTYSRGMPSDDSDPERCGGALHPLARRRYCPDPEGYTPAVYRSRPSKTHCSG